MHLRPLKCSLYFLFAQLDLFLCPGKSFLFMFNGFFSQHCCLFLNCFLCICLTRWEFGLVIVTWDSALHEQNVKHQVRLIKRSRKMSNFVVLLCYFFTTYFAASFTQKLNFFRSTPVINEFWRTVWIKTNQKSWLSNLFKKGKNQLRIILWKSLIMGIFMQLLCSLKRLILVLFLQLLQLQGIQIHSKLLLVINCDSFTVPFLLLLLQKPEGFIQQ